VLLEGRGTELLVQHLRSRYQISACMHWVAGHTTLCHNLKYYSIAYLLERYVLLQSREHSIHSIYELS